MDANLHGGGADVATMHVKTEAGDESSSALGLGSQETPAPCGDAACRAGGGGGAQQTAEELTDTELQANTSVPPVLLCEHSDESIHGDIDLSVGTKSQISFKIYPF